MNPAPLLSIAAISLLSPGVFAQSLFLAQEQIPAVDETAAPMVSVQQVSLVYVEPPEPRVIQQHDIVTIIIDETSSMTSSQKLETDKQSKGDAQLNSLINALALLELRIASSDISSVDLLDFNAKRNYTGEGDYERKDKFTARITAQVLEVKPNGTLVLQAVKRITKDDEIQTLVLSGVVRSEDITEQNTILSSQMANLTLDLQNEGELKDTSEKGLLTKVLDTVFAF
ncbi:MAG: flagellar basal body L-ring protein FlgH [Phycisphaerales bacterium]|nr:flagellar basal body L-ring protein FlgH [Phycisphaerales bacterium]